MSIIVTGIDIPKSCVRCDLCDSGGYCRALQRQTDKNVNERYKRCPLKSVDGLIETITEYRNKVNADADEFKVGQLWGIDEVTEIIKEYCGMEDAE